jgi:hypothetical protein
LVDLNLALQIPLELRIAARKTAARLMATSSVLKKRAACAGCGSVRRPIRLTVTVFRLLPGKMGKKWGSSGMIGKYPTAVANY